MWRWLVGALTHTVIKVTYDTQPAIKPYISPYFFLTFISKVILYVAQKGVGVTLKVQKIRNNIY